MSFINFRLTHQQVDPARTVRTLDAGFSREGGRPEFVRSTVSSTGVLPPLTREAPVTDPKVAASAAALLGAIQGAQWVQDVVVQDTLVREPATVTWTLRNGGGGSAFATELPASIQAVLDAAAALEAIAVEA